MIEENRKIITDIPVLFDVQKNKEVESQEDAACKAFAMVCSKWKLSESQIIGLLGNEPAPEGTLYRISLVISIYKSLQVYFGKDLADRWMTLGNHQFSGVAPIDYIILGGIPAITKVLRLMDSMIQHA